MGQTISDIITTEEISNWKPWQPVIIEADTGMGKSHFIKNRLREYAREHGQKILLLVNRSTCKEQFKEELKEKGEQEYKTDDTVHIWTYQRIQRNEIDRNEYSLDEYSYIVSDEFHYFLSDSKYNSETDISFKTILGQSKAVKIFMSATADDMVFYLSMFSNLEDPIKYELRDSKPRIESLIFTKERTAAEKIADMALKTGTKTIIFLQSVQSAAELYRKYSDNAIFLCSENNTSYKKFMSKATKRRILNEEKFDKLLLITTSCLDTGVTLRDRDIKVIYVDIYDPQIVIQCVGRKRRDGDDDLVTVIMPLRDNNWLRGRMKQEYDAIQQADYLKRNKTAEYVKKYQRKMDKSGIIYISYEGDRVEMCINWLMYWKHKMNIDLLMKLCQGNRTYAYCDYIASLLKPMEDENNPRGFYLLDDDRMAFVISKHAGDVIDNDEGKKALISELGTRRKTARMINWELQEKGAEYAIRQFESTRRVGGTKNHVRCWEVVPIEEVEIEPPRKHKKTENGEAEELDKCSGSDSHNFDS